MVETSFDWSDSRKIPSSVDSGHAAIEVLLAALTEAGWDGRDFFHVQMAVEEAIVNAIHHGNENAADKVVELDFKVSPNRVYLRIKDEGQGFKPDELPDPRDDEHLEQTNGRGVMLMKAMMNEVHFNERGNEVVMIKIRNQD